MSKVRISSAEVKVDIDIEDIERSLKNQGYGVVILQPGIHYFAFWSLDRSILLKGHDMIRRIQQEGPKCGYALHD